MGLGVVEAVEAVSRSGAVKAIDSAVAGLAWTPQRTPRRIPSLKNMSPFFFQEILSGFAE